jgi:competence protein ComEC
MVMKNVVRIAVLVAALAVIATSAWWLWQREHRLLRWTMVDVSPDGVSGDANLLEFADGRVMLVDTGFKQPAREQLLPLLRERSIDHIDRVVITHAHRNHYGGLFVLIDDGIAVDEVVFNLPAQAACDAERPWGCRYKEVVGTRDLLRERGIRVLTAEAGDVLYEDARRGTRLKVLAVYDGIDTPVGRTDINDTSIIMRLDTTAVSVMFAADLNRGIGGYLAEHNKDLAATILKVPHHGVESAAPNEFFDRVGAEVALVPGPADLWTGPRGERLRRYFADHHIPAYVNGVHGDITVVIRTDGYSITTARGPAVGGEGG